MSKPISKVLRDAKKACYHVYDMKKKKLVKVPDHKTRLAATTLSKAYHEGKPIERTISVSGDFEDLQSLLEAMKQWPAAQASLQKRVEGKEIQPALLRLYRLYLCPALHADTEAETNMLHCATTDCVP